MWLVSILTLALALPGAIVNAHILISFFDKKSKQVQEDYDGSDL